MDIATRTELFERIVGFIDSGADPMAPAVMMHPVDRYVSDGGLGIERAALFDRFPVVIGYSSQVRAPGDYVTDEMTARSLLVVRGDDGALRGFHNVCGHRGAKVEAHECGHARRFTCPYHAWSYDRSGSLRSIPNDDGFDGLDRNERGLVEFPVSERHGLIWALPAATAGEPLDVGAFLGDLDAELGSFGLDGYVHDRTDTLREPFNWKLVVDGFLETYHLRFLHRDTIGPYIASNFALFDPYGLHGRMIGVRDSFESYRQGARDGLGLLEHLAIIYQIFPNTVLVWQGDHFESWTVFPDGSADRMVARASLLAPPDMQGHEFQARWDKNWRILMNTVLNEDFVMAKSMQRNFGSGARTHAAFGRQEAALQHYHRMLEHEVGNAAGAIEQSERTGVPR